MASYDSGYISGTTYMLLFASTNPVETGNYYPAAAM
jgi:hypothetical protein